MTRDYSDTIDLLQQRVRQSGNVGTTQTLATQVLGMCERLANAHLKLITTTTAFSSVAYTAIYAYRSTLTTAIDILDITESNRPLLRCESLIDLSALDPDWFRASVAAATHRFEAYCQIARDFLVLYPAKTTNGSSDLSITYTALPTAYATYAATSAVNMTLPDENVEIALGLAEVILLSRFRDHEDIKAKLTSLARSMGITQGGSS